MKDQWIPILVRLEDYDEMAAWVARREEERGAEGGTPLLAAVGMGGQKGDRASSAADDWLRGYPSWPEEALERLAESEAVTAQRWVRALDVCAASEKDWLTTSEVAYRAGMPINEWRDAPRKIPRHLRTHYPDLPESPAGGLAWPLVAHGMPGSGEISWAMTETTRQRWRTVRGQTAVAQPYSSPGSSPDSSVEPSRSASQE